MSFYRTERHAPASSGYARELRERSVSYITFQRVPKALGSSLAFKVFEGQNPVVEHRAE
jgi:hypothetical protein